MSTLEASFYVTGGTLQPDTPSYVARRADTELYSALSRGEFCYVLDSRQMGKSSLMARTAARLRQDGVAVAMLELTLLGQNLTAEQWYDGLLAYIGQELGLEEELEAFWLEHERSSPLQRWIRALREVVLPRLSVERSALSVEDAASSPQASTLNAQRSPRLVICIDEIDSVRSLPFSTDEFFAAIRECYNRRSADPEYNRLTFCLLGVATPSDLIQDTRTTPFNIGHRIELSDFTEAEAAPLASGLGPGSAGVPILLANSALPARGLNPAATAEETPLERAVGSPVHGGSFGVAGGVQPPEPGVGEFANSIVPMPRANPEGKEPLPHRERGDFSATCARNRANSARTSPLSLWGRGRGRGSTEAQALLKRILYWTGGHPYLTQRLCQAVAERVSAPTPDTPHPTPALVDQLCEELFLSRGAREQDNNLLFVRERLLKSEVDRASLLTLYGQVRSGKRVQEDETNPLVSILRLSGITRVRDARRQTQDASGTRLGWQKPVEKLASAFAGVWHLAPGACLVVRNRIYARVFDRAWVAANMPDAELRRQRAAFRKGLFRSAAVACAVVGVVGALALAAVSNSREMGRLLYVADMNLTQQAVSEINWDRAEELLDEHRPGKSGGVELRGFEWRYLWRLCQQDTEYTLETKTDRASRWAVAYSPDGKLLAAANQAAVVEIWDTTTRALVTTRSSPSSGDYPASDGGVGVVFSPDGTMLAAQYAGYPPSVKLYDVVTRRLLHTFVRSPNGPLAFSPDGTMLASVGSDGITPQSGGVLQLWNVATRAKYPVVRVPLSILSSAFSPDGTILATGGEQGPAELWKVASKQRVASLPGRQGWFKAVAFAPDGTLATCGDDRTIRLWDVPAIGPHRAPSAPGHGSRASAPRVVRTLVGPKSESLRLPLTRFLGGARLVFSPDGKKLAAAGSNSSEVTLWWDVKGNRSTILRGHKDGVVSLAFSPDSETLATGSRDGTVRLWRAGPPSHATSSSHSASEPLSLAFAPDSATLATGNADGTVTLWNATSGQVAATLPGHQGAVHSVAFSPDGKLLASAGKDHTVRLWRGASFQHPGPPLKGHADEVRCVAFSPDGKTLASGGDGGLVKLWDTASKREPLTLDTGTGVVIALAFSPDGRTLALTDEWTVRLYEVSSRREIGPLLGRKTSATALAFSPDGKILATGSRDKTIVLWDVASRRPLGDALRGCKGGVNSIAFSVDGRTLASGSAESGTESSVRLWNVATGRQVGTLKGPEGSVACVAFSPDGNALAAGGKDHTVTLWRAAPLAEADMQGSSGIVRPLSRGERAE